MPALIPVDDFHGALLIGTVLSSILYGVTWSQVYSYYNNHCSRDRWPLKSFVAFLMYAFSKASLPIHDTLSLITAGSITIVPCHFENIVGHPKLESGIHN
ncbi:hypothetical protein H4582DRAFT_337298 [Lactarius indigo]|nr:hypothetical protein H4582DRAFT_337298 [Lactarius indigo]